MAYDPWGNRRNPVHWTKKADPTVYLVDRGFTGHEHLDAFGIINMNGRVYDPVLGMFLSPDPYVQAPDQWTNYNRYAYCMNNPLIYVDPDGLWSIGLGFVFGYDKENGWHAGFGVAFDVGFKNLSVNINASKTWSTNGSSTTTFNVGANINLGIVGVGVNLGYSVNSKTGSTFSAYAGANVVALGVGGGYNSSWDASGNYLGSSLFTEAYVGLHGLATYGVGYQWGSGGATTGWYQTASLFTQNLRNDGDGWGYQGFSYNMNLYGYNSKQSKNYASLNTEHAGGGDWISHSIVKGVFNGNNFKISWGPAVGGQELLKFLLGCKSQNTWPEQGKYSSGSLGGVSVSKLYQYSRFLNFVSGILPYNAILSSCVSHTTSAIYFGGRSFLGLSPYILEFFSKNKF